MRSLLLVGFLLLCQGSSAFENCDNGGYLFGNKSCNCPNYWQNDPNADNGCTEIQCINGGYSSPSSPTAPQRCVCPSGYLGIHCEAVTTFIPHSNLYKQSSSSSFTLVYVNLFSNYYGGLVYSQFQNALDRIIGGTNFAKKWLITNSDTPNLNPNSISDSSHYNFTTERFDEAISLGAPMSPVQFSCYGAPFFQPIVEHIMENGIRETAITILTQHPASNDLDPYSVPWYDRLIMLCQSFDIRINVVFSDDQTFVRCTSDDTNQLRELSKMTGGIFVTAAHNPDYTATGTIIDMVLTSHIAYEPITMSTNGTVNFNMNIPPDFKKYYIVAYGDNQPPALINNSNCQVLDAIPMKSDDNVYAYPISFNPSCTISFTNTKRVQVFGSNMTLGPVSVKLYKSYLETSDLDTSKIQPVQGNVHKVSIHVENTGSLGAPSVIEAFFNQGGSSSRLTMTKRKEGAMEYISNENITCDPSVYPAWIQLTLKGMPAAEKRYIPVFCQYWTSLLSKLDGSNPAGNNVEEETYWSSGERIDDDVTAATTADPASVFTQKTFVLGYSDKTTQDQQNSFLLGSVLQSPFFPYTDFGEIRFDINGKPDYHGQSTFGAFADSVYGSYGWNSSIAITQPTSQVMIALDKLANSELIKQNSLITMNLARVVDPTDPLSKISTVYPLVNRNTKVVMFIDKSALDKQNDINNILSPVLLNQVAAVTSGHFIVCNENDNNGFKSLLRTVFTQGPGQNLLLAKNFAGVTSRGKVGTLYLSGKGPDNINVTITFSTYVASNDGSAATSSILAPTFTFIHGNNTLSQTTIIQTPGSNFYTATVTLPGGYDVQVMLGSNLLYTQPSLLRIWTPSVTNDDVQITYKDLLYINKEHGGGPDDFNGAIPVVSLYNSTTNDTSMLSVTYLDCAGNYIDLYDGQQSLSMKVSPTDLKYVPYFCTATSSSCITGTENLYYSQYRSNTGFVATKTFVCVQDSTSTADNCNNQDTRGNYLCGGSSSPYKRGRAGLLIDCSDPYDSLLSYDDSVPATVAPFTCNCGGGADQGPSCENSDCTHTNTDGGAVDTFYRTYSIVVAFSPQMRTQSAAKLLFIDALKLLVPTASVENIWQYQLFAACPNGDMTTLFIGTNFDLFKNSFANVTQLCSEGNATDYDLTNVYERVVSSVGKQQRGLIVFYHEMDEATTQKVTVNDTDAFIRRAQQYQQQMYVFNVFDSSFMPPSPITSELISALMSTGGNVVLGDYRAGLAPTDVNIKFFTSILTASVSLNALEPITTTIDTVIETNSYIIATRLDNSDYTFPEDQFDTICKTRNDKNAEGYGAVCFVSSGTKITLTPSLTRNVAYSVVAIGVSSPLGIFITQRKDDRQTSVPVDYTTGGPTLAIYSPSSYKTENNLNKNARDANRKSSCTFVRSTVDVFGQLKAGFNSIKMTTQFNSNSVTKVYPFGVSSQISCQNGASVNIGFGQCICKTFWDGPDCSRPRCGPGTLSTWSNACNCPPTFTGQSCQTPLDPVTTQAPSTTVTSTTAQSSAVSTTDASTTAQS